MKHITLKPSGNNVPVLIQGLMRIQNMSIDEIIELLNTDLEMGIDYLDTSDIYAFGLCEELLGKAFKAAPELRDKFIIQTKGGILPASDGMIYYDFSKKHLLEAVDASLSRLGVDHIDYYLLHRPDVLFEPEEVAEAIDAMYTSGKVLNFGVSNLNSMQMTALKKYVNRPFEVNQLQLSPAHTLLFDSSMNVNRVESSSYDHSLGIFNYCQMNDCAIQAWSPFRASKSPCTGSMIDRFGRTKIETRPYLGSAEFSTLNAMLEKMGEKYGVSSGAMVVAWILRCPGAVQTVLGSTKRSRIIDACAGADVELSREDWYRIYYAGGNYSI